MELSYDKQLQIATNIRLPSLGEIKQLFPTKFCGERCFETVDIIK